MCVGSAVLAATSTACLDWGDAPRIDLGRDCTSDSDCSDYTPPLAIVFYDRKCNPGFCQEGRCANRALSGDIPDDRPGDCNRTTCTIDSQGEGRSQFRVDENDTPASGLECRVGSCWEGVSLVVSAEEGTACSGGVCHAGNCVAPSDAGDIDGAADGGSSDSGESGGG